MKTFLSMAAGIALMAASAGAQTNAVPNSQPNPYGPGESWGHKADGKPYSSLGACVVDSKGTLWVADRCGQPDNNACKGRTEDSAYSGIAEDSGKKNRAKSCRCSGNDLDTCCHDGNGRAD